MIVVFDIETIPTQREDVRIQLAKNIKPPKTIKKAETLEKWEKEEKPQAIFDEIDRTGLNGAFGEIISIAVAIDDKEPVVFFEENWQSPTRESDILTKFFNYIGAHFNKGTDIPPVFVGHNLVNFDLRFVYQRAVINGVKPFAFFPIHAKAWDKCVFDTMTEFAGYNNRISMNDLCLALGIDGKGDDIDGSKVWDFVQQGKIAEVAEYNKADVVRTRAIYNRMTFKG